MVLSPCHRTAACSIIHGAPKLIPPSRCIPPASGGTHRTWLHALARRQHHGPLPSDPARRVTVRQTSPPLARGKKTRSTVKLSDLPQGAIPVPDAQPAEDDAAPAYPTVIQQARRNMRKFDNCVLLTRVGGFYELYFEHADEYGPLLHLKIAQKKTSAGPVPMVTSRPLAPPSRVPPYPRGGRHLPVISSHVSNISLPLPRRGSPSSSWTGSSRSSCRT